jgi:site-specific recombinase XerD
MIEPISAYAKNTRRAYAGDWSRFDSWCACAGVRSFPASEETIRCYLLQLKDEGLKFSSINRTYAAIRAMHLQGGSPLPFLPSVRDALHFIGRTSGTEAHGKSPMSVEVLMQAVSIEPTRMLAVRDRALLLLGFAAALRRSDLVGLDVPDIVYTEDGLVVTARRPGDESRVVAVAHGTNACPVRAVKTWLSAASITAGPVFRPVDRGDRIGAERLSSAAVARAVKRAAELVGLDPAEFAGHSLRSGLATSAAKAGKGLDVIMNTTGHKSERVARAYIRHATVFDACASEGLL